MLPVENPIRSCVICGSQARCQNYGATTCEACKSFFRRASQGSVYKTYRCVNGFDCVIEGDCRRSCSYCRYQRCITAGMDITKGRSRREKANQVVQFKNQTQTVVRQDELELAAQQLFQELVTLTTCHTFSINDKGKFFTKVEIFDLDSLSSRYIKAFTNIFPCKEYFKSRSICSMSLFLEVMTGIVSRLRMFCDSFGSFTELNPYDQKILFDAASAEVCMINVVLAFNKELGHWLSPNNRTTGFYNNLPVLPAMFVENLIGATAYREKVEITVKMQDYHPDETVIMLLFAILLFTPSRPLLLDVKAVQKSQIHYALLLKRYLLWRFGERDGEDVFVQITKNLRGFRNIAPVVFSKVHGPIIKQKGHE